MLIVIDASSSTFPSHAGRCERLIPIQPMTADMLYSLPQLSRTLELLTRKAHKLEDRVWGVLGGVPCTWMALVTNLASLVRAHDIVRRTVTERTGVTTVALGNQVAAALNVLLLAPVCVEYAFQACVLHFCASAD